MTPEELRSTGPSRPTESSSGSAILGLRDGGSVLVLDSERAEEDAPGVESGGAIYTDMPTLQEVLQQLDVITAVIERPLPAAATEEAARPPSARTAGVSFGRSLIIGGIPVGTFVAGAALLVAGVTEGSIVPNPYMGLYLILAAIGLGVTASKALRGSSA